MLRVRRHRSFLPLLRPLAASLAAGVVAVFFAAALCAQEAAPKPAAGPDPELEKWLTKLDEALGDKAMARDNEACTLLQQIAAAYERGLDAPTRKKVSAAAAEALTKGKLREPASQLYPAAAVALSRMDGDGARAMQRVYEGKRFPGKPEWANVRSQLVLNIGRTRDLGAVDFLLERATRDPEDEVMAGAGQALGEFGDASQKVRKQIAKDLIVKLGELEGMADRPTANPAQPNMASETASRTLAAIRPKWNTSLGRITGQHFENGTEWQHWWNKNKERDWDKDKDKGDKEKEKETGK